MVSPLYRKLTKQLKENGCYLLRQGKGSHEIWFSPIVNDTFSFAASIKKTTSANETLKAAGLQKKF